MVGFSLIWMFIAVALLLQVPVMLVLIALAVIIQRTSQAAYMRALDNREKQLAFVVENMMQASANHSTKIAEQTIKFAELQQAVVLNRQTIIKEAAAVRELVSHLSTTSIVVADPPSTESLPASSGVD